MNEIAGLFNILLDEVYRQWMDFDDERENLTLADFVLFAKEIARDKAGDYARERKQVVSNTTGE